MDLNWVAGVPSVASSWFVTKKSLVLGAGAASWSLLYQVKKFWEEPALPMTFCISLFIFRSKMMSNPSSNIRV